eukprot:5919819-Ditylum_brightwellii.AAC.1
MTYNVISVGKKPEAEQEDIHQSKVTRQKQELAYGLREPPCSKPREPPCSKPREVPHSKPREPPSSELREQPSSELREQPSSKPQEQSSSKQKDRSLESEQIKMTWTKEGDTSATWSAYETKHNAGRAACKTKGAAAQGNAKREEKEGPKGS